MATFKEYLTEISYRQVSGMSDGKIVDADFKKAKLKKDVSDIKVSFNNERYYIELKRGDILDNMLGGLFVNYNPSKKADLENRISLPIILNKENIEKIEKAI
jgi:hypothetical protein